MQRSCESCIHTDVCKYKADYAELLKEKQTITKKNNEDVFEAIIDCKYYKTNEVIYKLGDVDYTSPYTAPYINNWKFNDPCKDCWVKDHNRNIDFGDNPCYYCSKNPYRVTCTDDSITTSTSKSTDTVTSTYTLN